MSDTRQAGSWALIPAAGIGSRMAADRPKQYLELAGRSILEHSIRAVGRHQPLKGLLVGIAQNDSWWPGIEQNLNDLPCQLVRFDGGAERSETVLQGLNKIEQLGGIDDTVLVHDAVRPLVMMADIERLVQAVGDHADGGLLALPVADTLKREQDQRVQQTVDRSHLWRALTPQVFPVRRLRDALRKCVKDGVVVTDEASALEHVGGHPLLVEGSADNIKITYPSDLSMAELLITRRDR